MARYTGFSTNGYEMNGTSFKIHDVPLIAHDLTNEIYTSLGEKYIKLIMVPEYQL